MTSDPRSLPVETGYDAVYLAMPNAPTLRSIWREHAMGDGFPSEFEHISFVTRDELQRITGQLALSEGSTLVDLGCGMGGPGLWIARQASARLIGVDLSSVGLGLASQRAERLGLSGAAQFVKGSFADTGLPAKSADGAVSFDALQYAPDKAAVFREAAKVIRPSGCLAFTAFEVIPEIVRSLPVLGDDPVDDYRPLLEAAGFSVTAYEETAGWRDRVAGAYGAIRDARDVLTSEMGPAAAMALLSEVSLTLDLQPYRRRIMAIARRR